VVFTEEVPFLCLIFSEEFRDLREGIVAMLTGGVLESPVTELDRISLSEDNQRNH